MPITLLPCYADIKLKADIMCNSHDRCWLYISHYVLQHQCHEVL